MNYANSLNRKSVYGLESMLLYAIVSAVNVYSDESNKKNLGKSI